MAVGRLKKLDSIHREGIRIYIGAFRNSPAEANDAPLELRRNKLKLRFPYKLKSKTSYMDIKYSGQQRGPKLNLLECI